MSDAYFDPDTQQMLLEAVPAPDPAPYWSWDDVLRRAGVEQTQQNRRDSMVAVDLYDQIIAAPVQFSRQPRRRRRRLLVPVITVAAAVVLVASALAVAGYNPFGAWFSGKPGHPASTAAETQFLAGTGRYSWGAFPTGTKLRVLVDTTVGGQRYVLYGFRAGDALCLRLSAISLGENLPPACAAVSTLEHTSVPLLVVEGDAEVNASPVQDIRHVSFGIVADGISHVTAHAVDGTDQTSIGGNAYLWVENQPTTGNRVLSLTATSHTGARTAVPVPVVSVGEFQRAAAASVGGPSRIQAVIEHPEIGWLVHRQPVGLAPSQVNLSPDMRSTVASWGFTRFVKPDPLSNITVGVSNDQLDVNGVETAAPRFAHGPLDVTTATGYDVNISDQFVTLAGVAADGVSKIKIFLSNGQTQDVPLKDNVFAAVVPQGAFRIVAYNSEGLVVGITTTSFPPQRVAPARAIRSIKPVVRRVGPNHATATLSVGVTANYLVPTRLTLGRLVRVPVRCWQVTFSNGRSQSHCQQIVHNGDEGWYDQLAQPVGRDVFIVSQTPSPTIQRVTLRFANGDTSTARPLDGVVIFAIPDSHLTSNRQRAVLTGYDTRGTQIGQQSAIYYRANR